MKLNICLGISFLLLLASSAGFSAEEFWVGNELLEVKPILESCENTSSVFRLERLNYSSGNEALTLNYSFQQDNLSPVPIQKTINKFTSSNTGNFQEHNQSKNISFLFTNTSFTWSVSTLCQGTAQVNESTEQENQSNSSELPPYEEELLCPEKLFIDVNKHVLEIGEKLKFDFSFDVVPEAYAIEYTILDAKGDVVRAPFTTTNLNTKSYTLKSSLEAGSFLQLLARSTGICTELNTSIILGIAPQSNPESIEFSVTDKQEGAEVKAHLEHAQKGKYEFYIQDFSGTQLGKTQLLEVDENSQVKTTFFIAFESQEEYLKLIVETPQQRQEQYFQREVANPKIASEVKEDQEKNTFDIIRTYTRQTKLDTTLNWYVRSEGEAPYLLEVQHENKSYKETITTSDAVTTLIELEEPGLNNSIQTLLRLEEEIKAQQTDTILLEATTLAQRAEIEQQERKIVQANTTENELTATKKPLQRKTILLSVLGILALSLLIIEVRKKYFIKKATFINKTSSQSSEHS